MMSSSAAPPSGGYCHADTWFHTQADEYGCLKLVHEQLLQLQHDINVLKCYELHKSAGNYVYTQSWNFTQNAYKHEMLEDLCGK